MKPEPKHLFFDLDDTVTMSRSPIDSDMYELLESLPHDIIIISGANTAQIRRQVGEMHMFALGQNGNEAYSPHGEELWLELLSDHHTAVIHEHIDALKKLCTFEVTDPNDLVEHRGAQISYSLIGHHETIDNKRSFDPERLIRRNLLEQIPLHSPHVEVKIGGTTCFDYFLKGKNKGYNVARLIEHMGWDKEACVYFGDALFPGGNDESVVGVIETVAVSNHRDTYERLLALKQRTASILTV